MKYYCIGIKGTGMSTLACMLSDLGNEVIRKAGGFFMKSNSKSGSSDTPVPGRSKKIILRGELPWTKSKR